MQVARDLGQLGHGIEQFVADIFGVTGDKADALESVDAVQPAQERGQGGAIAKRLAIGIHSLTEERDLLEAFVDKPADLVFDLLRAAGFLAPARGRDDAVGAVIVAPAHDRDPRVDALGTLGLPQGVLKIAEVGGDQPAAFFELVEQLRHVHELIGADHQIDHRMLAQQLALLALGHAAHDPDDQIFALLLELLHHAQARTHFVLGVITHRAGVE